jgi:hypothetical protein
MCSVPVSGPLLKARLAYPPNPNAFVSAIPVSVSMIENRPTLSRIVTNPATAGASWQLTMHKTSVARKKCTGWGDGMANSRNISRTGPSLGHLCSVTRATGSQPSEEISPHRIPYSTADNTTDDMGRGNMVEGLNFLRDVRIAYRECNQRLLADSTMPVPKAKGGPSEQLTFFRSGIYPIHPAHP